MCMACAAVPASSEALVEYKLLAAGADVGRPTRENAPYDLLMKGVYEWHQVQVKTAYQTKEGVRANVCKPTSNSRKFYSNKEVDFFAIVWQTKVYLIPFKEVEGKGRINVLADKYKKWEMA